MATGVAAAYGDQDVLGAQPAMEMAQLGQRVRVAAVLLIIFDIAVFADIPHPLDRPFGLGKRNDRASSRLQPAPATMRMCSGARITTLWPKVMQP